MLLRVLFGAVVAGIIKQVGTARAPHSEQAAHEGCISCVVEETAEPPLVQYARASDDADSPHENRNDETNEPLCRLYLLRNGHLA